MRFVWNRRTCAPKRLYTSHRKRSSLQLKNISFCTIKCYMSVGLTRMRQIWFIRMDSIHTAVILSCAAVLSAIEKEKIGVWSLNSELIRLGIQRWTERSLEVCLNLKHNVMSIWVMTDGPLYPAHYIQQHVVNIWNLFFSLRLFVLLT